MKQRNFCVVHIFQVITRWKSSEPWWLPSVLSKSAFSTEVKQLVSTCSENSEVFCVITQQIFNKLIPRFLENSQSAGINKYNITINMHMDNIHACVLTYKHYYHLCYPFHLLNNSQLIGISIYMYKNILK